VPGDIRALQCSDSLLIQSTGTVSELERAHQELIEWYDLSKGNRPLGSDSIQGVLDALCDDLNRRAVRLQDLARIGARATLRASLRFSPRLQLDPTKLAWKVLGHRPAEGSGNFDRVGDVVFPITWRCNERLVLVLQPEDLQHRPTAAIPRTLDTQNASRAHLHVARPPARTRTDGVGQLRTKLDSLGSTLKDNKVRHNDL